MNLSTTSYSILALLAVRDWTTYELAQQMNRTLGYVWPRAERKLYDEPKRLVAAGFATAEKGAVGRRAKTTYSITPAGRAALRDWLGTEPQPPTVEFEGVLRVLFADHGSVDQLRHTLEAVRAQSTESRDRLAELSAGQAQSGGGAFPERRHVNALALRFIVDQQELMRSWADWALGEIADWPDTKAPAETWRDQAQQIFTDAATPAAPVPDA